MFRSDLVAFMRDHGMPLLGHDAAHPGRIAVIDDEHSVVSALLRILSRVAPGSECRSAHDGFSAGALLSSFHPDLVFLDILMPGLSGIEVCEHIRATPDLRGTSVVIVSAHLNASVRARLAKAGADRCIEKPCSIPEIKSAVADFLSHRRIGTLHAQGHAR
jgi:CheY-like chemotaxis protein